MSPISRTQQAETFPPDSVFHTQGIVAFVTREVRQAEERLERMQRRLANAIEKHRQQIRQSLLSEDPEERRAAESIAAFWDVLPDPP